MAAAPNILNLLHALDKRLEQTESLIICGGVAVALAFGGKRQTFDVDVIAPLPLRDSLKSKVREVAEDLGVDAQWLNDSVKGFVDYIPSGWKNRLVSIDLGLKNLSLQSLGKVDLLMMKLKASRERDLADIKTIGISQTEANIILAHLDKVARFDNKTALNITLQLKEWGFV